MAIDILDFLFSFLDDFFPLILLLIPICLSVAKKAKKKRSPDILEHSEADSNPFWERLLEEDEDEDEEDPHEDDPDFAPDDESDTDEEEPVLSRAFRQEKPRYIDTEQDISATGDFQKYYYRAKARGKDLDPWDLPKENTPWDK